MPIPLALAAAAPAIIGGVTKGISSLFGGRARRREEGQAQDSFNTNRAAYNNFEFQNNYLGLQNTAEDLTVDQQAFQAQGQQTDQALASGLDAIVQGGGGGGGAQAIANAALQSKQGISASISQQEQANNQARIAQASRNQLLERQGAERQQGQQFDRIGNQYSISSDRLAAAKDARAQATQNLIGGVVGGGLGAAAGGAFGDKAKDFGQNLLGITT